MPPHASQELQAQQNQKQNKGTNTFPAGLVWCQGSLVSLDSWFVPSNWLHSALPSSAASLSQPFSHPTGTISFRSPRAASTTLWCYPVNHFTFGCSTAHHGRVPSSASCLIPWPQPPYAHGTAWPLQMIHAHQHRAPMLPPSHPTTAQEAKLTGANAGLCQNIHSNAAVSGCRDPCSLHPRIPPGPAHQVGDH